MVEKPVKSMAEGEEAARGRVIRILSLIAIIVSALVVTQVVLNLDSSQQADITDNLSKLKLPPGFKIELYARSHFARQLALSPSGLVFIGSRNDSYVRVAADSDGDHKADAIFKLGRFKTPNGVAFKDGTLYIGEVDRILKIDNIENTYTKNPPATVFQAGLPADTHHGWKYIKFGPDNHLYVAQGMPCNICVKANPIYGTILRLNQKTNGDKWEIYASGVRNSVGFDWDPVSKDLWFTDNGRDYLDENLPPDEINCAPKPGLNFGFPYYYGQNFKDPEFGSRAPATLEPTMPQVDLPAHVAALGMTFCQSKTFPARYQNAIFFAEHGSWNRSKPIGYQVSTVTFKNGKPQVEPFITGWLMDDGKPWGRPVDVLFTPDGSMLISDDHAGAVYRVSYEGAPRANSVN